MKLAIILDMYQLTPCSVGWHKFGVLTNYNVRSVHSEGPPLLSDRGSGVCVTMLNPELTQSRYITQAF